MIQPYNKTPNTNYVLKSSTASSPLKGSSLLYTKQGYNNIVEIRATAQGEKFVCKRIDPRLLGLDNLSELIPYLSSHKLEKEAKLSELLKQYLPVPATTYFADKTTSYSISEFMPGREVTRHWLMNLSSTDRMIFAKNVGNLMAKLHKNQNEHMLKKFEKILSSQNTSVKEKHLRSSHQSLEWLSKESVISVDLANKLRAIINRLLPSVPERRCCLIHGDIYFGNIFINQRLDVVAVIDWADSADLDDPLLEVLLTARWFAFGEFYEEWDQDDNWRYFFEVIRAYGGESYLAEPLNYKKLLIFYEILWHCKVLIAEYAKGEKDTVLHFQKTLQKALDVYGRLLGED